MDSTALYNLSPALRLMGMGLAVALGPLAWLWLRHRGASPARQLGALTLLTLFLTFDLVMFGAFTRLTDSGLGCPDWPGCYGHSSPVGAHAQISAAQDAMPTGPVTHGKAWVEMVHRYLATGVGVLIIVLLAATWWQWRRGRGSANGAGAVVGPGWPLATLVWVCAQGAFGALTVTMKLFPAIVTLHLLGGVGLLVLLMVQAEHYRQAAGVSRVETLGRGLRALLWAAAVLVGVQIALGGWVSTNYAVLACNTFPQCQGSWWPAMDFSQGFELWRPLGRQGDGALLDFSALTAIHYAHRLFAYGVFIALAALIIGLARQHRLPAQRRTLAALTALQLLTGLSNVILDWPLAAAVIHTGGAAAMMTALAWALCASRAEAVEPAGNARPAGVTP